MALGDASAATSPSTNGNGMAAILATGIGCGALGVFAFLGDAFKGISQFFNFYNPTGALSGVTDTAIFIWLASWYVLNKRWSGRDVAAGSVSLIAFVFLAVGFLLTFPPFMDLLQGK